MLYAKYDYYCKWSLNLALRIFSAVVFVSNQAQTAVAVSVYVRDQKDLLLVQNVRSR